MSNFICPVKNARLTSKFGNRILNGKPDRHQGVDLASTGKVPIYAAANGKVREARTIGSYGKAVIIEHSIGGKRMDTTYAHLDSTNVKKGDTVKQGQQIGIMGNTGNSFGIHLHFEIHNGAWATGQPNAVDPMKYISLKEELSVSEAKHLQSQINELQDIVTSLLKVIENKADIKSTQPVPSWANAKGEWKWAVEKGILDGTNPQGALSRAQFAKALKTYDNLK